MLTAGAKETLVLGVKERLQHTDSLLNDEVFLVFRGVLKHIHANRVLDVGRIKIDNIVDPFLGDALKQGLYGISVRIDKSEAAPITHILKCKVFKKDRFTHTSLANHIHVATTVFNLKVNWLIITPIFIRAKEEPFGGQLSWAINLFY